MKKQKNKFNKKSLHDPVNQLLKTIKIGKNIQYNRTSNICKSGKNFKPIEDWKLDEIRNFDIEKSTLKQLAKNLKLNEGTVRVY